MGHMVPHIKQELLMVLMGSQVKECHMGMDQGVPLPGIMGVTGDSPMEDLTGTMPLQVTSLLVSTQRHTSGSTLSTRTTVALST